MDRLLTCCLLFFLTTQLNANVLDATEQRALQQQIDLVSEYAEQDRLHEFSDRFIKQLQAERVKMVQIMAEPNEDHSSKWSLMPLYQALNEALKLLGQTATEVAVTEPSSLSRGGDGIIRGYVREAATGDPLDDAYVYLYDAAGVFMQQDRTDQIGRYAFVNLPAGSYYLSAQKLSIFREQFSDGTPCPGGLGVGCQLNQLTPINLTTGAYLDQVHFDLNRSGVISGVLEDEVTGHKIQATIELYDASFNYLNSYSSNYSTGVFSIPLINDEIHYLTFSEYRYITEAYDDASCGDQDCDLTFATPIVATTGSTVDLGTMQLTPYASISGRILDAATNQAIDHYSTTVQITQASTGYFVASTSPDADGNWRFGPILSGEYHLRGSNHGYLAQYHSNQNCQSTDFNSCQNVVPSVINHNAQQNTDNLTLLLQKGATISGQIYDRFNEVTSGTATLYDATGHVIGSQNTYSSNPVFNFEGLGNGTYYLSADNSDHQPTLHPSILCTDVSRYQDCQSATEGNPITITGHGSLVRHVRMQSGARITGRVTNLANYALSDMRVTLTNSSGDSAQDTRTDANGQYTLENIAAGEYKLVSGESPYAHVLFPNLVCQGFNQCDYSQGRTIQLAGNNTYANYNFSLPGLAKVTFQVNERISGQAVDAGTVTATNAQGDYISNSPIRDGLAVMYLTAGSYYFEFGGSTFINQVYGGGNCYQDCQPATGTAVNVSLGQDRALAMSVDHTFRLMGNVSWSDINYNSISYVSLYQNGIHIQTEQVNFDGSYDILVPAAGAVKVAVSKYGYFTQYYNGINCDGEACGLAAATPINAAPNQSRNIDFNLSILNQLKGRITNAAGIGLEDIEVKLIPSGFHNNHSTYTDNQGYYEFNGVRAGDYHLLARSDDTYESTLYGDLPCPNNCDVSQSQTISLPAGAFLANRNIRMVKRGSLQINAIRYVSNQTAAHVRVNFKNAETNNNVRIIQADDAGNIGPVYLPSGNYYLEAVTGRYSQAMTTTYPDIDCSVVGNQVCQDQSPRFTVSYNSNQQINDFKVNRRGMIQAQINSAIDNQPLNGVSLVIYDANYQQVESTHTSNGQATLDDLQPGEYFAAATTNHQLAYLSELYAGVPCGRGVGIDCLITQATPISISNNDVVNLNFDLQPKPTVQVNLVNAFTQQAISGDIRVFSSAGDRLITVSGQTSLTVSLFPGQYYLLGSAYNHNIIGYPDSVCQNINQLNSCATSGLNTITVTDNNPDLFLELDLLTGISGTVSNGYTGEPMAGVTIDFWRNGNHAEVTTTNQAGRFSMELYRYGSYAISTDLPLDSPFYNEVYNNKHCIEGSVVLGLCDLSQAEEIDLHEQDGQPVYLDFQLDADAIFTGAFD